MPTFNRIVFEDRTSKKAICGLNLAALVLWFVCELSSPGCMRLRTLSLDRGIFGQVSTFVGAGAVASIARLLSLGQLGVQPALIPASAICSLDL